MRQRRWIEPLSDYDCVIRYHPGKANVVTDAHGVPVSIISDLNPRFVSGFLEIPSKVIRDEFGYEHCLSSSN
ncbi:hypothetical protein Tco_1561561 [Tanacetum coccineum]